MTLMAQPTKATQMTWTAQVNQMPRPTQATQMPRTTQPTVATQITWIARLADMANISVTTDVHSPRRTLPSSDHPQQHVGFTSDAVCQFSQTHREGSSSQSRPYKRQAPSTQSRVPQDDPEIPEKQSKV